MCGRARTGCLLPPHIWILSSCICECVFILGAHQSTFLLSILLISAHTVKHEILLFFSLVLLLGSNWCYWALLKGSQWWESSCQPSSFFPCPYSFTHFITCAQTFLFSANYHLTARVGGGLGLSQCWTPGSDPEQGKYPLHRVSSQYHAHRFALPVLFWSLIAPLMSYTFTLCPGLLPALVIIWLTCWLFAPVP